MWSPPLGMLSLLLLRCSIGRTSIYNRLNEKYWNLIRYWKLQHKFSTWILYIPGHDLHKLTQSLTLVVIQYYFNVLQSVAIRYYSMYRIQIRKIYQNLCKKISKSIKTVTILIVQPGLLRSVATYWESRNISYLPAYVWSYISTTLTGGIPGAWSQAFQSIVSRTSVRSLKYLYRKSLKSGVVTVLYLKWSM